MINRDLYGFTTQGELREWIEKNYDVKVLLLGVTGSHMWNLATKDSDLDIRGVYQKPTDKILSIHSGKDTIESCGVMGKDIDIQLYELEKALGMMLGSNGNIIELLRSPTVFFQEKYIDWRGMAKRSLSRKLANYYKGYAHSQRERAARNRGGKALVYTYREIMAGTWLMRTGKIVYDFRRLKPMFEKFYGFHSTLLDWAIENKDTPVERKVWDNGFVPDWEKLLRIFEDERSRSILPENVENYEEFNKLLLVLRKNWA